MLTYHALQMEDCAVVFYESISTGARMIILECASMETAQRQADKRNAQAQAELAAYRARQQQARPARRAVRQFPAEQESLSL